MTNPPQPDVTVVIPTYNSGRTLEPLLDSVRSQEGVTVEIVVADNHSTDGTVGIAARRADAVLQEGHERSEQRNAGLARARGRNIAFLDSDMLLGPGVLGEAVALLDADPALRGVIVPEVSVGTGFWSACKVLERTCYVGDDAIEAARVFRTHEVREVDGYDPRLVGGGEDWDLPQRLGAVGGHAARTTGRITHDEGRIRLRSAARKKFHYGHTIGLYLALHPDRGREQARLVRPSHLRNLSRMARRPHLLAGVVVLRIVELGSLGLGALASPYRGDVVRAVLGRPPRPGARPQLRASSDPSSRSATSSRS